MTYTGTYNGTQVSSVYTKDENGRVFKCQDLKMIRVNDELNISEVVYYNSDGTIADKDKVWQI